MHRGRPENPQRRMYPAPPGNLSGMPVVAPPNPPLPNPMSSGYHFFCDNAWATAEAVAEGKENLFQSTDGGASMWILQKDVDGLIGVIHKLGYSVPV